MLCCAFQESQSGVAFWPISSHWGAFDDRPLTMVFVVGPLKADGSSALTTLTSPPPAPLVSVAALSFSFGCTLGLPEALKLMLRSRDLDEVVD